MNTKKMSIRFAALATALACGVALAPAPAWSAPTCPVKGATYNRYRITWSTPNPAWSPTPGILPGGADFHIGTTFTGVDFNQPDPIIIQNLRLFDASSDPLTLHPRLPGYDAGEVDGGDGSFDLNFFANGTGSMVLQEAVVFQLPRRLRDRHIRRSGGPALGPRAAADGHRSGDHQGLLSVRRRAGPGASRARGHCGPIEKPIRNAPGLRVRGVFRFYSSRCSVTSPETLRPATFT